ncbi:sigma 54-interacting transcriptional regulator [Enterococcus saccharolyticus]|uniref:sigma 54-interacting transcriptional regulator n=1 Tax=Enterococcus saccharolyticus TaxID=41997 RepID=UPI001E487958|nr:sigma-54-dependent transcriptional regulator [Enterococcus saccharolyticus]MCD5001161.1 sigma 54-interacting transcriptional regulator [Enterococcus saccharolyticus]
MKKKLLEYLANQTAFIDLTAIDKIFTATELAKKFDVKRNTISHYLNQLNEQGEVIKINSRPVYFFHKEAFENQFYPLRQQIYTNAEEIVAERPFFEQQKDLFSLLIGYDKSLSRCIEQIKMALYYPDNGLPTLITGESGTGKSFLVNLIYRYCFENDLISGNAPFVTVNCAQYANNPELLTSNLFGHVKGAFTGADYDKQGAFEAANKGILFLDEVHRLNAEGQEKLFTFLDQGIIYRMGDTNHPIPIQTRIFFATTENLESNFLTTFIRRIPIQIEIPAIDKRSHNERLELVYSFLLQEQKKIKRRLTVTGQVLTLLTSASFKGNIGELKNIVKITVAKAFTEQQRESSVHLTIYHLPEKLLMASDSNKQNSLYEEVTLNELSSVTQLVNKNQPPQQRVIQTFEHLLTTFQQYECKLEDCDEIFTKEVETLFDFLLFETDRQHKQETLLYLTQYIRESLKQMETSYQIKFNGNSIYAISYYLFQRSSNNWFPEDDMIGQLIQTLDQKIAHAYPVSYHYVERILELSQPKIDLVISPMDKVLLTIYLKRVDWTKKLAIPRAIIVAHGYATASSIANVANRFLGKDIFESFDMPLDVSPQRIAEEILDYSETNDVSNGLVILVDMGSLKEIYQYFPKQLQTSIVIMNNVTTMLAISVGESLQKKCPLEEMISTAVSSASFDWEIIYPEENKMNALITTCFTGIGTANQISHLLEKSLPSSVNLSVIPYEYTILQSKKQQETIFSMYDVVGIIGTANPDVGKPYLSLEELISGDENQVLSNWLVNIMTEEENKRFMENMIRNFSLEKVIDSVTILDTEKVMSEVELFMRDLERVMNSSIPNPQKLALYVHVSCLIERLIRNVPIDNYDGYEQLYQCQRKTLLQIKQALSVIERDYSVKIPDSEIAYIYDILFGTVDISTIEEDF